MSKVVVRKNLNRWFKEKWVDVSRTGKDGKHPPCGRSKAKKGSKGYPKCRPSVKVSSKTPKTSGSMTSGQKRAATKRKRSKKQGVGGKPTIVKQEVPFADANHPVSMTEVSNLMLEDSPQQCTIQDCPNPEAQPVVRARYRNPIGSQDYTHHMCENCAHRHELGYMVQKGEPIEIAFDILKQEEPFEAFDEETPDPVVDTFMSMHRKVPVKMKLFEAMERARKDPSVHPGIGSRHIFDTPFGHSTAVEPTISGTNALFPLPNPRPVVFGQQFQIADPKQMARLSRDVDYEDDMEGDGMFHAEAYQMPGVQTELVSPHGTNVDDKPVGYYSRAMANVPTFRGMPFNEETYFTTGEPMDLAFRLLKTEGLLSSDTLER